MSLNNEDICRICNEASTELININSCDIDFIEYSAKLSFCFPAIVSFV